MRGKKREPEAIQLELLVGLNLEIRIQTTLTVKKRRVAFSHMYSNKSVPK